MKSHICENCKKSLEGTKKLKFCSADCASIGRTRKRLERVCSGCEKIEYVSNTTQLKRKCRSCSKIGNTASKNMSEEARKKISESKKGITPWNKGKTGIYSKTTKKAMGVKNLGKKASKETNRKRSNSLKKYYTDKQGPNKGVTLSDNQKQKISDSLNLLERSKYTIEDVDQKAQSLGLKLITNKSIKISQMSKIKLKCICGEEYTAKVQNFMDFRMHSVCKGCTNKGDSLPERELLELLKSFLPDGLEILKGTKPCFMDHKGGRYQLDLFIPEKKLAIEFHGLAHHSERLFRTRYSLNKKLKKGLITEEMAEKRIKEESSKVRDKHETKYLLCKSEGVQLIQIFEDEWRDKPEIVRSMLKSRLGASSNRIYARKCEIKELTPKERRSFFQKYHIAGDVQSKKCLGLSYNGEIVSAISLRGTWNKAYGDSVIEIARFASKLDSQVVGGFSKLLKYVEKWALEEGYSKMLTYADCRFGEGGVYTQSGFCYIGKTKPNYFYEKNGIREDRFKHRKNNYLEGASEREQQNLDGWYAIYDAGSNIYTKELGTTRYETEDKNS